jgi:hypothetical protein
MPPLPAEQRKLLENTVIAARDAAEAAAKATLVTLAVERQEPFATMSEEQKLLRRALRAKARQLGGGSQAQGMPQLIEEIAYQQWHRMLFARFLAENNLLRHPMGVPVSLQDCAELAAEEGGPNGTVGDAWELAARYAGLMLPGIFLTDDPTSQVRLAPESRHALEKLVQDLSTDVFTADDALGWSYQFWQSKKKDEVNKSERKIGGADLYPVTQLFTEDYMVRFLLENSLGAWWAVRHPDSPLVKTFTYLRFLDDGTPAASTPAAGAFPGWPEHAAQVTVMDPCGGSGHFVVAAFEMLRRMRMEEEGLDAAAAADATIRDNIFMLEIDPRCTQIAAFALVFAAWKAGGYRALPIPNIACSGIAVEGQLNDWLRLAGDDSRLRTSLERLCNLFRQAPTLGSLIDPAHVPASERMWSAEYDEFAPLFERVLARERVTDDLYSAMIGSSAQGVAKAAKLLVGRYTLVATNVPYLAQSRETDLLKEICEQQYEQAKANLATAFMVRCRYFAQPQGVSVLVIAQQWLFQPRYEQVRRTTLSEQVINHLCRLGAGAFETISGEVVNVALTIITNDRPTAGHQVTALDATAARTPSAKAEYIRTADLQTGLQRDQLSRKDARIAIGEAVTQGLLSDYSTCVQGLATSDDPQFTLNFWELPRVGNGWEYLLGTVNKTIEYGGRERIIHWENGAGRYYRHAMALKEVGRLGGWKSGTEARGKRGVIVSQMGNLPVSLYTGEFYDHNASVIVPLDPRLLPAIWAFCKSPQFGSAVRAIDPSIKPSNNTLIKVPFDVEYWQAVAEEAGPLPTPSTNDPPQWLFAGRLAASASPLQVAVGRLLAYQWPAQQVDEVDACADLDGIVCLPPVAGEPPATERLRSLMAVACGDEWSVALQQQLLSDVAFKDRDLADWLRDGFFEQHCRLFLNRPFIWHIWDGRKDGFSALVNYHKLDAANFDKLIYTYLGNWIETQRADAGRGAAGADGRLVAALELKRKLELIRDGEPPYDIYVRWKPLAEQPLGWNPDLNDGVRLNIRPFVTAGVLRSKFTIKWGVDRGKNPDGSVRDNDLHFTRAQKLVARAQGL